MGRAPLGLMVLALAAMVAAVLSGVRAQPVAGRPALPPPAPPPQVGDCLLSSAVAGYVDEIPVPGHPLVRACDGSREGEVVHVGATSEAENATCAATARRYVGLTADVRPWIALPPLQTLVIGPNRFQTAAGQRWAACVAYSGEAVFPLQLAHLLDQWVSATPLSQCDFDPGVTELRDAQCSAPHRTEVLGTVQVTTPLPDLQASCRALAAAATRMPDPTAGGALRITATITHAAAPGAPTAGLSSAGEGTATCAITTFGARTLAGSLLGLGGHAVPWA